MEVRCPQCTQRLRYSDVLRNPLLRCRTCGTTFRPGDLLDEEPVNAVAVEERQPTRGDYQVENEPKRENSESPSSGNSFLRIVKTILFIIVFFVVKFGFREARRDRAVQKPPAKEVREDQRQKFEKRIKEARERAERARKRMEEMPNPRGMKQL